jgi:hypothetical protein
LEQDIAAGEEDQAARHLLQHGARLGPAGLQEVIDQGSKGAGQDNQGALTRGIGEAQGAAVSQDGAGLHDLSQRFTPSH